MHSDLAKLSMLLLLFTAGFLAGALWGVEAEKHMAVKQGEFYYNGHTYGVTGIRPRGE